MKGSIPQLLGELMAIHTLSENENIQILQECKAEYESLQKELTACKDWIKNCGHLADCENRCECTCGLTELLKGY